MKGPQNSQLIFNKINYILLVIGLFLIVLGYTCMALDPEPYGFGILGITLGPIMLMMGFIVQFFAIMYVKKEK